MLQGAEYDLDRHFDAPGRFGAPHLTEVALADPIEQLVPAENGDERTRRPRIVCGLARLGWRLHGSFVDLRTGQPLQLGKLIGEPDAVAGQDGLVAVPPADAELLSEQLCQRRRVGPNLRVSLQVVFEQDGSAVTPTQLQ